MNERMLVQIHVIQNHCPANLNRDDLGAPKTCYFGGVLRSRISSQCLKRSIRLSAQFADLLGGIRTRQLAKLISNLLPENKDILKKAISVLKDCGIKAKDDGKSDMLVYTTTEAIREMADMLRNPEKLDAKELKERFSALLAARTAVPDMALSGRMLETGEIQDTTVEASLQVAHAISTHEAHPEIDYYIAADDIKGDDAGAGFVDEALFASACFYKYFSIDFEQLKKNLKGHPDAEKLAAHTVGAFLTALAFTNPTGKQNSFAAHNPPDGILVELRPWPVSYANAFARPVSREQGRDIVGQSIAQLATYVTDIDTGYGEPVNRFWFSPNNRTPLEANGQPVTCEPVAKMSELVAALASAMGYDWAEVSQVTLAQEELACSL